MMIPSPYPLHARLEHTDSIRPYSTISWTESSVQYDFCLFAWYPGFCFFLQTSEQKYFSLPIQGCFLQNPPHRSVSEQIVTMDIPLNDRSGWSPMLQRLSSANLCTVTFHIFLVSFFSFVDRCHGETDVLNFWAMHARPLIHYFFNIVPLVTGHWKSIPLIVIFFTLQLLMPFMIRSIPAHSHTPIICLAAPHRTENSSITKFRHKLAYSSFAAQPTFVPYKIDISERPI